MKLKNRIKKALFTFFKDEILNYIESYAGYIVAPKISSYSIAEIISSMEEGERCVSD